MALATEAAPRTAPRKEAVSLRSVAASPLADYYLVIVAAAFLCAIGGLMVTSASSVLAMSRGVSAYHYISKQLVFMAIGIVGCVVLSRLQPQVLRKLGWWAWALAVGLLMLVMSPLGHHVNGNTNWISIAGFTFQPSEFAKLALVIWGASVYHLKRGRLQEPFQLMIPFLPGAGVILALVLAGKDLGTGLIVGTLVMAIFVFAGASAKLWVPFTAVAAAMVTFLVCSSENRLARFRVFLDPAWNSDLASQPMAAQYALASGGWWGRGLGASLQKWGGLKTAAHTDYIFAVVGEELGLFGALIVIVLFALFARSGFLISLNSDKLFNRLAAAGVTTWIIVQAVVNMLVVMHVLPVLGVPLPFMSYGGSAIIANLFAVGVLLACARDTPQARAYLAARDKRARRRMTSVLAAGGSR